VELRRLGPDDWSLWRTVRLQALREAPYAFGSSLSDWQGEGDREARWRARLDDVPFNIVALIDGRPIGQVSGTGLDEQRSVELISIWVAPGARGIGVGAALIDAVAGWADACRARSVWLAVKSENFHAIALYERAGFLDRGVNPRGADERIMTSAQAPT
jgi:ribosomal protein S18 acetylase RimI-like enzyme